MGWERGAGPLSPVAQAASSHLPAAGSNCLLALLLSHVLSFLLESYWIAAPQSQGASCCGAHRLLLKAMGERSLQSVGETCLIPGAFWRSSSPSHCRIGGELVGVFLKISTLCVLCQVNSFILTVCCCTPWSEPSIDFFQWLFNVFVPFFFFSWATAQALPHLAEEQSLIVQSLHTPASAGTNATALFDLNLQSKLDKKCKSSKSQVTKKKSKNPSPLPCL